MRKQNRTNSLLASLLITFSAPVLSHTGAEVTHSFIAGLIHPWLGIDHILVMFAIGLWSRVQGGKQVWLLPLTFLFWMTTGAALGFANNSLPYPELWVTLSVIVFGLLVVNNRKVNPVWAMTLVALFALGHGYVHATEIPKNADQTQYALGFLITTVILHSLGIMVGIVSTKKLQMIRINFGLLCAAVGVMLLAGWTILANQSLAYKESSGWQARLRLGFAQSIDKTLLVNREQIGPLTVQRPFYPEGGVCHVYLLHPPGGIVGGDDLSISVKAASLSHVLITTPAAGKFYRSAGAQAKQTVGITIANGATVEWLPQETIIYEGAQLKSSVKVNLAADARFIGWEILSLGRPACAENFDYGLADLSWQIYCEDRPVLLERLYLDAKAFSARCGLQGNSACGTMFATPASAESFAAVQELIGETQGRGVTRIDNLLVCRALDIRSDRLRGFFEQVWAILRPDTVQRKVCSPRIWAT